MIQYLKHKKWRKIIAQSGLFDTQYYLFTYPDVRGSDIDPIMHYIKHGAAESRNPSKNFDTKFYLESYDDVRKSGLNPLVHYELYGKQEARKSSLVSSSRKNVQKVPLTVNETPDFDDKFEGKMLVTVLCRTYNHERFIRKTLESIISQKTNFGFKVLIGDDQSEDNTFAILSKYQKKFPSLITIIQPECKMGSVGNLVNLSRHVDTKYVAICDGDDCWTDQYKLYKQVAFLEKNSDFALCYHGVKAVLLDGDGSSVVVNNAKKTTTFDDLINGNYIYMSSVMYRWMFDGKIDTDLFNTKALPADWQLHLLHAQKGKIGFLNEVMGIYNRHSTGMWSDSGSSEFHLKYGIQEIELFKHFQNYRNGKYSKLLINKQYYVYRVLGILYYEREDYESLFELVKKFPEFTNNFFEELGYRREVTSYSSVESFISSLRNQNTIDVIITSYNHESYINKCIQSVLMQKGLLKLRVIISDDCSTDNTNNIIEQIVVKNPNVFTVLRPPQNIGMKRNLQLCINSISSNFVAICEGDDYWIDEKKLHKQIKYLRMNQDCSMCFNWLLLYRENENKFEPHPQQARLSKNKITFNELKKEPIIGNFSCCCYRKEAIKQVPEKYFDDSSGFDWLFNMYIARNGMIGFMKDIMSVYRIHHKGLWSSNSPSDIKKKINASRQNFSKHF